MHNEYQIFIITVITSSEYILSVSEVGFEVFRKLKIDRKIRKFPEIKIREIPEFKKKIKKI